jgi:hypothetical protein
MSPAFPGSESQFISLTLFRRGDEIRAFSSFKMWLLVPAINLYPEAEATLPNKFTG